MKHSVALPAGIPAELAGDIESRLHYSSSDLEGFRLDLQANRLEFTHRGAETPEEIERKVLKVVGTMVAGYRRRKSRILVDRRSAHVPYDADPMPGLERSGAVRRTGVGQYSLGPLASRLLAYFDAEFQRIGAAVGAMPYQFPTLIEIQKLARCDYFGSFSQSVSFVMHLTPDVDVIEDFSGRMKQAGGAVDPACGHLAATQYMLSPAVCFHLYAQLADRPLGHQPVTAMAQGKCFRYESGNLGGLERLWDFTMREVMFVGGRDEVETLRRRSIDLFVELMDRIGLQYWIETATDPFFIGDYAARAAFQSALELKYEIRLALPYKGTSLAAGSFNYHQDFFGRAFHIGLIDGGLAHTGCTAMGLERWVLAFLAQYGPDPAGWPAAVRGRVAAR